MDLHLLKHYFISFLKASRHCLPPGSRHYRTIDLDFFTMESFRIVIVKVLNFEGFTVASHFRLNAIH